jgi:hypothetical protein
MNYEQLLVLVSAAVFSATATAASAVMTCARPWIRQRIELRDPRRRAQIWMAVRFLPCAAALIVSVGFAIAFARYEPRHTSEQAGSVLIGFAAWTIIFVLSAASRVGPAIWNTARCHRLVKRVGEPIEVPGLPLPAWRVPVDFPLAAVSGILKPRLVLSSRIVEDLPPDELAIVLRHEAAHARRRDNLARLALIACPDPLEFAGRRTSVMLREWHHAVEEAADEEAAGSDRAGRAALASALVRVGRMSATSRPSWMPALALYDGHPLESRVRRLLTRKPDRGNPRDRLRVEVAGALLITAAVWIATGPRLLHACLEWSVRNLP